MRAFVLDLPGFRDRIGPVKASSLRVASRITNTLRAGYPVGDCGTFESCGAVLLCMPDCAVPVAVRELADASIDWAGRTVVLCESQLPSDVLKPLASCGAYTACMDLAPGPTRIVLVDGHRNAVAEVKAMLGRGGRLVRIHAEQKARYYGGLTLATLCGPLAALAGEELRAAGFTPAQAKPVVESVFLKAVRDYVKSGKKVLLNGADPAHTDLLRKLLRTM